ncbi:MAG TPA: hypothetical protein VER83_00430 [Candidatus Nanopelagicales bacterium]|nr:hypothetical protein [Candidatus Nanopelagicales bacterium]
MKINARLLLRRTAVTVAVVGSLVLGAATIRAAGQWTANEAPLAAPPVTVESLAAQLAAERGRSSDLVTRLEAVAGQTVELQAALDVANARIQADTATAKDLSDRIAAAKKKLAALNRQIAATAREAAAARTVVVRRIVTPAAPAPQPTREPEHDD